ncbi:ABC transporter ATP-binding protein [Siphonobacter sp. BAB-5405]|uniref:ABC-F family ATP-binding cassette domain-containing protein n=1 Tax=Siphonobacter sp. BAB-5405 TaxID=1864825 RepID=UPI000C7FDB53|nr:ABC-F family ATP-binding cassette domain-containing protein [Siphonobacter sp. BAB-5405]PMD92459.1 ABC transporter ATP-binding protein [Siphonobacter sp. BAB-5405]
MSIIVNALSYVHANGDALLDSISLSVATGEKAALVGNNGVGKSTLLQIIAGQRQAASGEIVLSEKPYYVPQHVGQYDSYTVAEVLGVAEKLKALRAILSGDAAEAHFTTLADDWELEERLQAAFESWHIKTLDLNQTLEGLSGGEKTKVFLAGLFLHSPGIVLLDEPTNHLDGTSRQRLYRWLSQSKATVLIVSHDRALLNQLDTTLELGKGHLEVYGGNYDFYQEQKRTQREALKAQADEHEKTLKQAQQKARDLAEQRQKQEIRGKAQGQKQALPRIIAGGRKTQAEQSTAKLKEVHQEKLQDLSGQLRSVRTQLHQTQPLHLVLESSDLHHGKLLIEAQHLNQHLGESSLWPEPLQFQICSGDRIRIQGPNGSGKTTLLKLATGQLTPSQGEVTRADFSYVYLDQEYSLLASELTVFEQVQRFNNRQLLEHDLKNLLHQHQLPRASWDRTCDSLSGGEKMKLALCCLQVSQNRPDLLLLDEPTNNLDLTSQQIFTRAVKDFKGSLLVISHDEYFIEEIQVNRTLLLS